MRTASTLFDNNVRYRPGDHPDNMVFTPDYVLDPVIETLGWSIALDPCTTPDNPVGALRFYALPDDGLALPWDAETIFVNPPYGKARIPWIHRCIEAAGNGSAVVLLINSATDTQPWQEAAAAATEFVFIKGKVKFGVLRPNRRQFAHNHPSTLFGFGTDLTPCAGLGLLARRAS